MTEREPIPDAVPFDVREATLDDAAFLAECRRRMFDEMGADAETTDAASKAFVAYVEREMPAILLPLRGKEGSQAGGAERREGRTS